MGAFAKIIHALKVYRRSIFIAVLPLVLLPVFLHNNIAALRCLYVVLIMGGFWVTEVLPLPVTALIPMVLFPLMGVLDSDRTSLCYLKETNMMFVGGLVIAIAVEHCNLHKRVALYVILTVGCSPRRLNLGLVLVSMFVSMWISNTAAIAMMCPIIEATLKELESQGIGSVYENRKPVGKDEECVPAESNELQPHPPEVLRPSKTTICYFLTTAYATSIGGLGCIVGSGTNLTFKGIFETRFPKSNGIEFTPWMALNVPIMLVSTLSTWLWMQVLYMGMFRPKSEDSKRIQVGPEGAAVARKLIKQKMDEMGPMTFHEGSVAAMFCLSVLLWFFRKPQFIAGWAELITDHKVKDATAALIVVMLLFILPARADFLNIFSNDPEKRPTSPSPPLVTWKVIQQKLPWGLIFLLGGGFALAEGSKESGMSELIAEKLSGLAVLPPLVLMILSCLLASLLTEFSSNVAIANVILPVLAEMALVVKLNPLYLMLPAALCCSHAFCLPVGTPPNAIAAGPCNIPTAEMVKSGLGVSVICFVATMLIFPTWGEIVYPLSEFPDWAT